MVKNEIKINHLRLVRALEEVVIEALAEVFGSEADEVSRIAPAGGSLLCGVALLEDCSLTQGDFAGEVFRNG